MNDFHQDDKRSADAAGKQEKFAARVEIAVPSGIVADELQLPQVNSNALDLVKVMSVYINSMPAKGLPFLGKRFKVHDISSPPAELNTIAVNYSR